MSVVTLATAAHFELGALKVRSLAVPSRGSRELAVWRVDLPSNSTSGPHSVDHEQVIVVDSGTVTADIGGEIATAQAGDAVILPVDTAVEFRNNSSEPASATVISTAGFTATAGGHTFAPPWSL
jgi:quercetin dioxygenase-like cupin family protein